MTSRVFSPVVKALAASCFGAIFAMALSFPLRAQDRLTVLLDQYQHEADPVRKARVLSKLGDDQVDGGQGTIEVGG